MKRGGIEHPKTKRLMRALGVARITAVGVLESLFHWTARYAICGNIGKYPDQDIADGIEWDGDATQLIEALVTSGWLDRDETHRLVVHDIHEHADNTWRQCLDDAGLSWWNGLPPRRPKRGRPARHAPEKFQSNSSLIPEDSSLITQPEPEPEEEEKTKIHGAQARRASRGTWLTPYLAAWEGVCGGQLPPGQAAKALAPVRAALGDAEALARWGRYLAATESRFASAQRFAATHGTYANGVEPSPWDQPPAYVDCPRCGDAHRHWPTPEPCPLEAPPCAG